MAQVAKERAVALRKSLKQEMLQRKPSFSEAEAFVLRGLLLDTTTPSNAHNEQDAQENETAINPADSPRELSDEILFSLPTEAQLLGQKAELPPHHKPAKRRSTLGLWKAFEGGFSPNTLLRRAAEVAGEDKLAGKEVSATQPTASNRSETERTDDDKDDEEDDDIASDVEVRPGTKSDASAASSWDEDEHQDNFDTWEVRR